MNAAGRPRRALAVLGRIAALALAALLATLVLGEFVLRAREAAPEPVFERKGKDRLRRSGSHPELAAVDVSAVPDGLRIVYLGASTVLGVPYDPLISPPRWLELVLRARGVRAEVVTVAGTGLAAADLAQIFPDLMELRPDAIVLDTGHNEYLAASELLDDHWWRALRVACWLEIWFEHAPLRSEGLPAPGHDFDHASVVATFARSLSEMRAVADGAGVPLLLCTPVSNLADFPPVLGGDPARPEDADAAFERGRELLAAGNVAQARVALQCARDGDRWPHRASSDLLGSILDSGCTVVRLDLRFDEHSARGVPGFDLFADHCHPTPQGQRLMAIGVADALEDVQLFPPTGRRGAAPTLADALPQLGADAALFAQAAAEVGRTFTGFAIMSGRDGRLATLAEQRLNAAASVGGKHAGEVEANYALLDLLRGRMQSAYVHLEASARIAPDAVARLQRLYDDYPWVRAVFDKHGLRLHRGQLKAAKR